jgi:AAA domain-containing protein
MPRERDSGAKEPRFKLLSLDEIESLPPLEWLIEGLIPASCLAVLYGAPKLGKSFLALDWALCVAADRPWHGRTVRQGDVVYVYAEGVSGLKARTAAWTDKHGRKPASFRVVPSAVDLPSSKDRAALVAAIRAACPKPRLIVIDTLARNFGAGDENDQRDMNAFVQGCDALVAAFPGATVLAVHHPGKDRRRGARGSLVLTGALDTLLSLQRSGDRLKLVTEMQKDGEPATSVWLALKTVELPDGTSSCVIAPAGGTLDANEGGDTGADERDPRSAKTDSAVLTALATFGNQGARATEWQRAAAGVGKTAFYAARDRLLKEGRVRQDGGRYFLVEPDQSASPQTDQKAV